MYVQLNTKSQVIVKNAYVDAFLANAARSQPAGTAFQFERQGYFVVDKDSNTDHLVFNLAVSLNENVTKSGPSEEVLRRRAKQAEDAKKSQVHPKDLFKQGEYAGKYTEYDADGIPTKDAEGEKLAKSAMKKLKKDQGKHKKKWMAATGNKA